jgi:hypothetical protein
VDCTWRRTAIGAIEYGHLYSLLSRNLRSVTESLFSESQSLL